MNAIHEEFRARGLTVLLVNIREELDTVRRTGRDRHYTAPVVLDPDGRTANIPADDVQLAIGRRDWASDDARRLLTDALVPPSGPRP